MVDITINLIIDMYSTNLTDYKINFNNLTDSLECVLNHNGIIWKSKITQSDLNSGMISLSKLMNLVKMNIPEVKPDYVIKLELVENQRTNTNYLVMNIGYSNELIEFEEKIYFRQANTIEEAHRNQQIIQEQKISQQQKQIDDLVLIIKRLEQKINELEDNQYITIFMTSIMRSRIPHPHTYCLVNNRGNKVYGEKVYSFDVPKNVNFVEIEIFKCQVQTPLEYQYIIKIKKFSFMDGDFQNLIIGFLNSNHGYDKFEIVPNTELERILKFINLKKIIIFFKCADNMYNQPMVQQIAKSIVNFLETHLLKKFISIEINHNQLFNELKTKNYDVIMN